ncbi:D-alanyl-D-alanine carboxypeptidase family protein [Pontixanthobacter luteolus]|uniref:D-alanyl-D-alanine carboxypeptidase family protein n=1 Tax=Pontixanthobacter luteolus TaxID=295089 RepID=UPI002303E36C|nr:D-alanyl-D-alanine carboxypeptidase family protein [Pontixanthobacter luteolus]
MVALVGGSAAVASQADQKPANAAAVIAEEAPVALLVDMTSGQTLFAKNEDRRFIPASITKVMSAYVAFEMIKSGELDLRQQFTMSPAVATDWYRTGSTMFLEEGEAVEVDLLLKGITSVSANDASAVLAEGAAGSVDQWVNRMNETAAKLGMRNSHFGTPNGWPDGGKTFTTARDLELLAKAMISRHPDLYARYFGKEGLRHNGFAQANHDPISGRVDGADGIKTGYTNQAGNGFLGSAAREGTRLILVLAAVDDEPARGNAARKMIEWGFAGYDRQSVFTGGQTIARAQVQNGEASLVGLKTAADVSIAVPIGDTAPRVVSVLYDGPLEAPIRSGERVARLTISGGNMPPANIELYAAEDVAEAGHFKRISNAFESWF